MDRESIINEVESFDVRESVLRKINSSQLPIPTKPLALTEDVNIHNSWEQLKQQHGGLENIPFNELGEYLDKWTTVLTYTLWVEGVADMEQASAREQRDTVKEQLYTLQEGGRELRAASVRIDPLYRELESDYTEKLAFLIAVRSLRVGYEKRIEAISREITRRLGGMNNERLSVNRGNTI